MTRGGMVGIRGQIAPSNWRETMAGAIARLGKLTFLGFCASPGVAALSLFAFVWVTFHLTGSWPHMHQPDPKDVQPAILHTTVAMAFLAMLGSVIVVPAVAFSRRHALKKVRVQLVVWCTGVVAFVGLAAFDSGRFLSWFLD